MNRTQPSGNTQTMDNRLPAPMGLYIDRQQPISMTFEGQTHQGFCGDSIASALAADGRYLLSRSFKYHRPRGPLTMAGQDANTLVQLPDEPNVLADTCLAYEGLNVTGQNYSGSLDHDSDMKLGKFSKFMPVGFYYRSFYKPKGAWKYWESLIRKKAGLGHFDLKAKGDYHDKAYLFKDVVVVGSGPAGLKAALTAAEGGAQVLLVEQEPLLGGALTYARTHGIPTLGLCLGLQCMVIEYSRTVLGLEKAGSTEFDPETPEPVIATMWTLSRWIKPPK